jgi:hypothetical protein
MKYYIGDIEEQNGDFEYSTPFRFKTDKDPNEKHDEIARTWRDEDGHEWDEQLGHYWCEFTGIKTGELTEISKEVYDALNYII